MSTETKGNLAVYIFNLIAFITDLNSVKLQVMMT